MSAEPKYEIARYAEGVSLYVGWVGWEGRGGRTELTPTEARRLASDLMQAAADVEEIQQGQEQMA